MALTTPQRLGRLKTRLDELKYWRAREGVNVTGWTIDGAPIAIGGAWPDRKGVHKFAATAEVPEHWPLDETSLMLDLGGESLVTLSYPNRDSVSFGGDPNHREFPVRHRQIAISAEATAREPFGVPVRSPHLNRAVLQWIDQPLHRFHLLLRQVHEAATALGDHEVVPLLLTAAEDAYHALDWPSDTQNYIARLAPTPMLQGVWELPELVDKPAALDQGQRASVTAAHEELVKTLKRLQDRFP
jgi:alpha-mannosidase